MSSGSATSNPSSAQRLRRQRAVDLRKRLLLGSAPSPPPPPPPAGAGASAGAGGSRLGSPSHLPVSRINFESTAQAISFLLDLLGQTGRDRPADSRRDNKRRAPLPTALKTLVPVAALYALVKRGTTVDREIDSLVREGKLRRFRLGGARSDSEHVVMRKEDYQEQVRQAKALFEREMRDRGVKQTAASAVANDSADHRSSSSRAAAAQVPSLDVDERPVERVRSEMFDVFHDVISSGKHTDVSVTQAVLTEEYGLREEEITQLIKYGLLTTEPTENVLKFSARGAGAFVTNLTRGRTDLCRFLKRAKYMEMLESQLLTKRLTVSAFPVEIILLELLGSGRVESIHTTMGQLIKSTKKGEETK